MIHIQSTHHPFSSQSLESLISMHRQSHHQDRRKPLLRSQIKCSCHVVVRMKNSEKYKRGGSKDKKEKKKQTKGAAQGRSTHNIVSQSKISCKIHCLLASHISLPPASPKQSIALCSILASCPACPALSTLLASHSRNPCGPGKVASPHSLPSLARHSVFFFSTIF
jgi:hypothetical protein